MLTVGKLCLRRPEKQEFAYQEFGITTPGRATTGADFILATAEAVGQEPVQSGSLCGSGEAGLVFPPRSSVARSWASVGPVAVASHWAGHLSLLIANPARIDFRHLCAHPC